MKGYKNPLEPASSGVLPFLQQAMRSFITCLFLASGYLRTAFADSITQPRVPETVRAGGTTTFFATVNSDTTGRRIYGSLIELMYGPSASLGNEVADIVGK
jgi:hypothetical protein